MLFLLVFSTLFLIACGCGPENKIVYGTTTAPQGDWSGLFMNNATDMMIGRELTNDYDTMVFTTKYEYELNPVVIDTEKYRLITHDNFEYQEYDTEWGFINTEFGYTEEHRFVLHQDLYFNNGDHITADDYIWNLCYWSSWIGVAEGRGNDKAGSNLIGYTHFNVAPGAREGAIVPFTGIVKHSTYEFSIFIHPNQLPYYFSSIYAAITPRSARMWMGATQAANFALRYTDEGHPYFPRGFYEHALQAESTLVGNRNSARTAASPSTYICTGPYQIVQYSPGLDTVWLSRNPYHKGSFQGNDHLGRPIITKSRIEFIDVKYIHANTQLNALENGEIGIISQVTDGAAITHGLNLTDRNPNYTHAKFERNGYGKITFVADYGPTQFLEVRHALAHCIDRRQFADEFTAGNAEVVHGPYGIAMRLANRTENPRLHDNLLTYDASLVTAAQILDDNGWTYDANGNPWQRGSGPRYKNIVGEEIVWGWAYSANNGPLTAQNYNPTGHIVSRVQDAVYRDVPGHRFVEVERPDLKVDPKAANPTTRVIHYGPVWTDGGDSSIFTTFSSRMRHVGNLVLMPLIIDYVGTNENEVTDMIEQRLVHNQGVRDEGIHVQLARVDFANLQQRLQREGVYAGLKTACMFNLATNYTTHIYDQAFAWSGDHLDWTWLPSVNNERLFDLTPPGVLPDGTSDLSFGGGLDYLSTVMVYGDVTTYEEYREAWTDYIIRWNEILPELPLYSNHYYDFFHRNLMGYYVDSLWTFGRAIKFAHMDGF